MYNCNEKLGNTMRVQTLNLNFGVKDGLKLNQELKRKGIALYKSCTANLESIKTVYI